MKNKIMNQVVVNCILNNIELIEKRGDIVEFCKRLPLYMYKDYFVTSSFIGDEVKSNDVLNYCIENDIYINNIKNTFLNCISCYENIELLTKIFKLKDKDEVIVLAQYINTFVLDLYNELLSNKNKAFNTADMIVKLINKNKLLSYIINNKNSYNEIDFVLKNSESYFLNALNSYFLKIKARHKLYKTIKNNSNYIAVEKLIFSNFSKKTA